MNTSENEVGAVAVGGLLASRAARVIALAGVIGGLAGLVASVAVSPTFESEVSVQIGIDASVPVENAKQLASVLESEGFRQALAAQVGSPVGVSALRVEAVDGTDAGASAYLRIVARGGSPAAAQTLAALVADEVIKRHAPLHEAAAAGLRAYHDSLSTNLARLDATIADLQRGLAAASAARENATAVLLMQTNLVTARTQQATISKEFKDHGLLLALGTRPTRLLGLASRPAEPVWPLRTVFAAAGMAAGLLLATAVALVS